MDGISIRSLNHLSFKLVVSELNGKHVHVCNTLTNPSCQVSMCMEINSMAHTFIGAFAVKLET